jgi:hypothetical protein
VVVGVQVTEVAPANWLETLIEDPDTEATEPVARGRPPGTVVDDPADDEAPELGEPAALPQAAASTARVPTMAAPRQARRRDTGPPDNDSGSLMVPPLSPAGALPWST